MPQRANSSHTEEVISWLLPSCPEGSATLGGVRGPSRVTASSAYPLYLFHVHVVWGLLIQLFCNGNVCLKRKTWDACWSGMYGICLPALAGCLKRRKYSVDSPVRGLLSKLIHLSSHPLFPLLTSPFLVGEIRRSKRQHFTAVCFLSFWVLQSQPSPSAQRCFFKKLARAKWQVPCALWLQPHGESQLACAFFSCTSYTKPHYSLERSWC